MSDLLAIILCLAAGLLLQRARFFPTAAAIPALNAFAIDVAFPALILHLIPTLTLTGDAVLIPALIPWLLIAVTAALVLALARHFAWSRDVTRALLLVVPLGNTAFIGLPLIEALIGPHALPYALLYDQLGSFPTLLLYGTFIAASGHTTGPRTSITKKILTFPPFIALLLGFLLLLTGLRLPTVLDEALASIAASLVPTALVAVGLGWRFSLPAGDRAPLLAALAIKLLILPAVAWIILALWAPLPAIAQATILQAGVGPMVTAGALAIEAGFAPTLVMSIVGWGAIASLLTVPLWALFL